VACFGEKDYQQLALIRKMVIDLNMDIDIIGVPTVREMDGLAMSSRNGRLTMDERQRAPVLARTMRWISSQIRSGKRDYTSMLEDACDQLRAADIEPDEIFIRDARTLQLLSDASNQAVILVSAFLGSVRLIDNLVVDLHVHQEAESEQEEPEARD
jgi:pantoate--beta-alanine ligase